MSPIRKGDAVPVAAIQAAYLEAVESGRLTASDVARDIGYVNGRAHQYADVTHLQRTLGLRPQASGGYINRNMAYDTAVKIVLALGLDPVDFNV